MAEKITWLGADELAWSLRCEGYSLEICELAAERAAIYQFDAGLGELEALVYAAADTVDQVPAARRMAVTPKASSSAAAIPAAAQPSHVGNP
jgi:hypothetical protein